jgi:NADPH2:quinone reductase
MVSFGNSSGPVTIVDVKKMIQPKSLYFTRPTMWHYLGTRNELQQGTDKLFENIQMGKIKVEIFKKYKLDEVVQAHKDLEERKIIGSAVIVP